MQSNLIELQKIVDAIDVTPHRTALLYGKPYGQEFSNPYVQQPSSKMLFQNLQELIYTVFYSRNGTRATTFANSVSLPSYTEIETFINELSFENVSQERFDHGWHIDHIDAQGMITAKKGNYTRPVHHGEFLNTGGFHHPPMVNQSIRIVCRKEYTETSSGFYYLFGRTLTEDNADQLVRIYFNIKATGIKLLIRSITELFNTYSVPFSFKCANHPFFFTRCDAAVLYLDKRYSSIAFDLLEKIYPLIKNHLSPDVPLFAKKLAGGMAFAENPRKQDESFGTHISKMLAQGIMNAVTKNVSKQFWLQEIKANIEQQHQYKDIERLYMNADSVYPYSFPEFV